MRYLFITVVLFSSVNVNAQISQKDLAVSAGSMAAFGCLKSGIGATMHDQSFVSGCLYGVGSAGLMVGANMLMAEAPYTPGYGPIAKVLNDVGASVQDNVMLGNGPFSSFVTMVGPVTVNISKEVRFSWNITSAVGILSALSMKQYKFDIKYSLATLNPIFKTRKLHCVRDSNGNGYHGITLGNTILRSANIQYLKGGRFSLSHELIHTLQFRRIYSFTHLSNKFDWISPIQKYGHWDISQDIMNLLLFAPSVIPSVYNIHPLELEAYAYEVGKEISIPAPF